MVLYEFINLNQSIILKTLSMPTLETFESYVSHTQRRGQIALGKQPVENFSSNLLPPKCVDDVYQAVFLTGA